jgi:inner membrane protein
MSSFIGHSLAGLTTYAIGYRSHGKIDRHNWGWLIWLLTIALIPDIDYLIPALKIHRSTQTLRITHSLIGVLLVPMVTIFGLFLAGVRGRNLQIKSYQLIGAGLSHLLLDLLTGVFPEPLLYPISDRVFRLPFGLLPSAGKIDLKNYLFYRNLLIEIGVLLPLSISLLLSVGDAIKSRKHQLAIGSGLIISAYFMFWAANLSR